MLPVIIPAIEVFDDDKQEFVTVRKSQILRLEHSLISISKWESKWHKPFLSKIEKTDEEIFDYIRCMTLDQNIDPDIYNYLSPENVKQINEYIEDSMTATTFPEDKSSKKNNNELVTSELIYYWMVTLNIPKECEKWHVNRLLTLIRVCNVKNAPPKKMSRREAMAHNRAVNAANRKRFNSRG